jgi:uncharacterized membrane protein YgdD (TMEM256/DUF423 family)
MRWGLLGSIFAALAVGAGAFGAHALRESLTPERLAVFETAARYQMTHALALLAVAWRAGSAPGRAASAAGGLFVAGIFLFSGSLYALALSGIGAFGALTPLGGLCLISGWVALAMTFAASRPRSA